MVATEAEFVTDNQALAIRSSEALMPALSMQQAVERYTQIKQFVNAVMDNDRDYGVIPGAGKNKVLLKPGAEKLCTLFNLKPRLVILDQTEDWMGTSHGGEAFFSYHYKIQLYRNEEFMGEADAALNSWEEKYRWRSTNRKCPTCGAESIINGKKEYGGGFVCFAKKGGCGAKFKDGDTTITSQQTGRAPNDRIFDQINTMRKMCYKRALIAATLVAVNASDFFTQDLETEEDAYQPHSPSPEPPREEEPSGPATERPRRLTPDEESRTNKLIDTVKDRKIPIGEAMKILRGFGFEKTSKVTAEKFNEVLSALCNWKAPEPPAAVITDPEAYIAEIAEPAPAPPQTVTGNISQRAGEVARQMSEKESLAEKRKEIDSLGQQLLSTGVPIHEIQSTIETHTGVRESKYIDSAYDANATIVKLESLLEQAQAQKKAVKKGK